MFDSCLTGLAKDVKPLVLLGAPATCWSIWLNRNDMVFGKKKLLLLCRLSLKFSTGFVLISLVHPSEAGFIGFGCGGLRTIGTGGHMFFLFAGTWMAE